jgi:pimeloyl-ACP methyl ester carboxylesterase
MSKSLFLGPLIVLVSLIVGCGGSSSLEEGGAATRSEPEPGEHVWTTPDGNSVPYSVAGKSDADVTVVFVHCWMCNRTFWEHQLAPLAGHYRTVALDLPGHGEATAQRDPWRVGAYGEDVAGLVRELELSNVVLVGHSMGGPVSLRAAALLPGRVRGIVAVDTLQDADFKFPPEQVEQFLSVFESDFVGACESFVNGMFPEEGVDAVIDKVRAAGCDGTRSAAGTALMRDYNNADFPALFREAGVPIRAINAAAPYPTNIENNRKYADFDVKLMDGVGHYPHMTRPDEFNALLLETLAALVAPGR